MPNIRQTVAARESLASKIKATLMAKFGKKMGLRRVRQGAKEMWHAVVVTANQTAAKKKKNCGMTRFVRVMLFF
jgi:predicted transcriptional regulator